MDGEVVHINVIVGPDQGVEIGVTVDLDDKLVALAIVVAVVGVVSAQAIFFAIRLFVGLIRTMLPEFQG